jgi:saccharopine dehydrogenase (NAD+, L-lysine-forming)
MGRLIAHEATRRKLNVVLAARQSAELVELAGSLPRGQASAAMIDVAQPATLKPVISRVDLVLNTIGPFSRFGDPVVAACIKAGKPYVDLANELPAVRALLDRDAEARDRGAQLVTGAGFGVVATETLALTLARVAPVPLVSVEVAAAQAVAYATPGVKASIAASLALGSPRYVDGQLVFGPLGDGATTLQFPDGPRQVIPVPVGDLLAAQRATGAANVVAYAPVPGDRSMQPEPTDNLRSFAIALGETAAGGQMEMSLSFGEGFAASAAIAVEVALRALAAPQPGAWTPGQLYGAELATACGALVRGPLA